MSDLVFGSAVEILAALERGEASSRELLPATAGARGCDPRGSAGGVQIVAPHLDDLSAIHFAGLLTEQIGGYRPPPGFDDPVMVG